MGNKQGWRRFISIALLLSFPIIASGCGLVERQKEDPVTVIAEGTIEWPETLRCLQDSRVDYCTLIVTTGISGVPPYVGSAGTSLAAPFVSAAAGMLLAQGEFPANVAEKLVASAVPLGDGKNDLYGGGALDVAAALGYPSLTALPVEETIAQLNSAVSGTVGGGMSSQSLEVASMPTESLLWDDSLLMLQANPGKEKELQAELTKLGDQSRKVGHTWLLEDPVFARSVLEDLQQKGLIEEAKVSQWWRPFGFYSNDALVKYQWAFDYTRFPAAWSLELPLDEITVAVVDTGVKRDHEDLADQVTAGCTLFQDAQHPLPKNYKAQTKVEVEKQFDLDPEYYCWDEIAADPVGHGTQVAGVIAAIRDNKEGIAGAGSGLRIMPVRVMGYSNGQVMGPDETIAYGIYYAAAKSADVINLSLGGSPSAETPLVVRDAIDYAIRKGSVVVAAAGNNYASSLSPPAKYDPVIAVGAINIWGVKANYSNYGVGLDLVAPGGGELKPVVFALSSELSGTRAETVFLAPANRNGKFSLFLPAGTFHIYGWIDMNLDSAISSGDYLGYTGPLTLSASGGVTGLAIPADIEYKGEKIEVR